MSLCQRNSLHYPLFIEHATLIGNSEKFVLWFLDFLCLTVRPISKLIFFRYKGKTEMKFERNYLKSRMFLKKIFW